MSSCKRAVRAPLAICVALSICVVSQSAFAAPDVITVPWRPNNPTIPASAYQGKVTTFKAIIRNGTYPVTLTWDFDDGSAPVVRVISSDAQARDAGATHLYVSAVDRLYNATVTATDATGTDMETYPVLYDASVPADPFTAEQAGDDRSLQIMRNIAASDGLWYLHKLMVGHVGTNNQMTGFIGGNGTNIVATNAGLIWAMGINGHFVAFPPGTYLPAGGLPDEPANDARWNTNPYAEDILRVLNWLLVNRTQIVTGLNAQEESNLHGFPEVTGTPIAGSDDGRAMFISRGGMYTYEQGHAVSALARGELAGLVAQVGQPNVIGEPFEKLVQQMVDGLIFGQVDAANLKEGGWYYTGNHQTGHVDLSTTLWGVTGLWHAERFMGDQGVIVNNFAKARMLKYTAVNSHSFPYNVLQAGERCGGYRGKETLDPCSLMIGLSHTLLMNYLGANTFNTTDTTVLFPAAYAGWTTHTRGQLRTMLDEFNAFNGRMFWQFTQGLGWNRQLFGTTAGNPYNRTDRRGNHYGMLHFKAAAQAAEPLQTLYGPHNWERQFTVYHIKNQFPTGMMQPVYNFNGTSTDQYTGAPLNTIHAILTFIPDSIPPLDVSASATPTTANEGDTIDFDGTIDDPGTGTITWTWDFQNGDTVTGADPDIDYAFPNNGVFNVELRAQNVGGVATDTVTVTINNVAPTADAGPDLSGDEGSPVSFSVAVTDPGTGDVHTYAWDFGDTNTSTQQNPMHTYRDNGTFNVSVTVDDGDDNDSDNLVVTVSNVAPTVDVGPDLTPNEGDVVNFSATVTDPGLDDVLAYDWDFGDTNTSTVVAPSHTYANNGTFTVSLDVDDGDDTGSDSLTVTVANVAPTVDAGSDVTVNEGATVNFDSTVTDPGVNDVLVYTWDFADGNTSNAEDPSHTYGNDGIFTVSLSVNDGDDTSVDTLVVTVNNVAPIVDVGPDLVVSEGDAIGFNAAVTDPGTNDFHTYAWDFGDGNSSSLRTPTHSYPDEGNFVVAVVVNDGASNGTDNLTVTVNNVAPTLELGPGLTVDEGSPVTFSPTVTDPGTNDVITYSWDFGDGNTSTDPSPTHGYPDEGSFTVSLGIDDGDSGTANDSVTVTVNNVAPIVTSTPPTSSAEGVLYTYTLTFTDPGPNDTQSCTLPSAPPGMTLTGCTVEWTPTLEQSFAPVGVQLCVVDNDGGTTCQNFSIAPSFTDTDNDNLPDTWETGSTCATLEFDQWQDPDNDGLNNLQELFGGTDPCVYDGPLGVSPVGPVCDSETTTATPTLSVTNATDPQGDTLLYEFVVYRDPGLLDRVDSATDVPEDASGQTSWMPTATLSENTWYYWTARAEDAHTFGQWSAVCRFFINATDEAPSAPRINSPAVGSSVNVLLPSLVVDNSVDPENDPLTYEYEIYSSASLDPVTLVETTGGVAEGVGTTSWTLSVSLAEDTWYWWRARSMGDDFLISPWSDVGRFFVTAENAPPGPPAVLAPQGEVVISDFTPDLVIFNGTDIDGDELTYDFQIATDESFEDIVDGIEGVPSGSAGPGPTPASAQTSFWTVRVDLSEDTRYCWRARASDGTAVSDWVMACFVVSATNSAPTVPTLMNPGNNTDIQSVTPGFTWMPSTDPEGDAIRYRVEILDANDAVVQSEDGVVSTTTILNVILTEGLSFKWRAKAIDAHGEESEWSEPFTFRVVVSTVGDDIIVSGSSCSSNAGAAGSAGFLGLLAFAALLGLRRRRGHE